MRITALVVPLAASLASGCIVISKHESLAPDEQAARDLKQLQSVQEVQSLAGAPERVRQATIRTAESRADRAGAGLAPPSD
jgi:hypothetical protein